MCNLPRFINAVLDAWDESQHKSDERKLKAAQLKGSLKQSRDEQFNEKAKAVEAEAKLREARARVVMAKVGREIGKNR